MNALRVSNCNFIDYIELEVKSDCSLSDFQ